ncbi:putative lipid II flippase MurJ, partial [Pseudolycoriella hygida]
VKFFVTLFRSSLTVAFFTFVSRIFGLSRELFIASLFGASSEADSVNVAFKLPNLFRRIFGEGALSVVFIPIFNAKLLESTASARHFAGTIFTILLFALIIIVILMQIFMPALMFIIAPGFYDDLEKFNLTVILCRITIPYLVFISVTALLGGILNSLKRFAAFAFSPIILSLSVIFITLLFRNHLQASIAVSVSLLVAGILQVVFMFFCVVKLGLKFSLIFAPFDKDVKKFLFNMGPASISSGVQQLNIFISQSIASFIEGAISILSYADRIYQFPLSIIGVTFGTILLPELSQIYSAKNNLERISTIQNNAIRVGLLLSLPAACGIIALSQPIIHVIYERGAFTIEDTVKTAETISVFALGLPAFIFTKILMPIFYANHDTKTPLKVTLYSLLVNAILNIILMIPFNHVGIALGSSIAAWYNVLLACLIMLLVIYVIKSHYFNYYFSQFLWVKSSMLAITILSAICAYSISNYQDFLKSIAVFTMFVDHVGLYFFPEYLIMRCIGRTSMPIFCFFAGYNFHKISVDRSSKPKIKILIIGLSLSIFTNILFKQYITPNILISIFLGQCYLYYFKNSLNYSNYMGYYHVIFLSLLWSWTWQLFDYGTIALAIMVLGYMAKCYQENTKLTVAITIIIGLAHAVFTFPFSHSYIFLICIMGFVEYVFMTRKNFFVPISLNFKIISRNTLGIYAVQL